MPNGIKFIIVDSLFAIIACSIRHFESSNDSKYIMKIEKTIEYLAIIRFALDENSAKPHGIKKVNWFDFFQFATQHEVLGAIYQGILRLGASGASIPKEVLTM